MEDMSGSTRSRPGEPSRVFAGLVGRTVPAAEVSLDDVLIDPTRYPSEGDWAFCRFDDERIPALRMGFQRGGFNYWPDERPSDPERLQLHLEAMTADGGLLWLPTGAYPASELHTDLATKDVRLVHEGRELLSIRGWPRMTWHARSEDGELETELVVNVRTTTVLPDSILPHAVFGMWETMGEAHGWVRIGTTTSTVRGRVFYDHTRALHRRHEVEARQMYLYTTLGLDDGGGLFGYHAVDDQGRPIEDYCFGVYVDATGRGTFLAQTGLIDLEYDADGLPARWTLDWRSDGLAVRAAIAVRLLPLLRAWGSPSAPTSLAAFPIVPLVLDADVSLTDDAGRRMLRGAGLAEHFDARTWAGQGS